MPIHYGSQLKEHEIVRTDAGMFDVSHMTVVDLTGPDAQAYLREAAHKEWQITQIWNTHWHPDHAGGNEAIKAATGCTVTASTVDAPRTPAVDRTVGQGDKVSIARVARSRLLPDGVRWPATVPPGPGKPVTLARGTHLSEYEE